MFDLSRIPRIRAGATKPAKAPRLQTLRSATAKRPSGRTVALLSGVTALAAVGAYVISVMRPGNVVAPVAPIKPEPDTTTTSGSKADAQSAKARTNPQAGHTKVSAIKAKE